MTTYRDPGPLNDLAGLKIVVRDEGATRAIELHGEWDLAGLRSVRQAISSVLDGVPDCVVLDLSRLGFIDSSGLHATIELNERLAAQNTRLVIIPGPRSVQRLFEITGLLERLPFADERPRNGEDGPQPALASAERRQSSGAGRQS